MLVQPTRFLVKGLAPFLSQADFLFDDGHVLKSKSTQPNKQDNEGVCGSNFKHSAGGVPRSERAAKGSPKLPALAFERIVE